ncbi:hypothetical protein B0H10DRAFT_1985829 [Mycena sp. CBHHK59/15]|nr:hypothetical protein B0H10DRAFT_1985829 [Mycena sp. CBHHK59/15]
MACFVLVYIIFTSLCGLGRAALTNHTIDDTSPLVVWKNPDPTRFDVPMECNATTLPSDPLQTIEYGSMIGGGFSDVQAGTFVVPFTGSAVYVFVATLRSTQCRFLLHGENVAVFYHPPTQPAVSVLGYSNTTIPNGLHIISIATESGIWIDFDGIIYSSDDEETSSVNASVSPSQSSSTQPLAISTLTPSSGSSTHTSSSDGSAPTSSSTSIADTVSPQKKSSVAAIAGGVVGGVLLIAALLFGCVFLRRRVARKNISLNDVPRGNNGTPFSPHSDPDVAPDLEFNPYSAYSEPRLNLAEQVRLLENQNTQLRVALQGQADTASRVSTVSMLSDTPTQTASLPRSLSTMKRQQTRMVQSYASSASDVLMHTDSGIRLEPGRVVEEVPPTYGRSFIQREYSV